MAVKHVSVGNENIAVRGKFPDRGIVLFYRLFDPFSLLEGFNKPDESGVVCPLNIKRSFVVPYRDVEIVSS